MLYLIGLGLNVKDISLRALEIIKSCDKVYVENYTNFFSYPIKEIEKIIKKKAIIADRKAVEEEKEILNNAKKKKVAMLVMGDPLAATTHMDLLLRARKLKIKTKIIHAPSVFTAIAESGLQLYKFGKTVSIAKWRHNFRPESFYDIIKKNLNMNAHTLVLIDIGLSVNEALGYLESIAKARDNEMLNKEIVICEKAGTDDSKFSVGKISVLIKKKFKLPACIIIPAKLHFMEQEALDSLK